MRELVRALRETPEWPGLTPDARHVALTLAVYVLVDDPVSSRMGIEGLARHTGLPEARVQVCLRELQRVGLIKRYKPEPYRTRITTFTVPLPARASHGSGS